MNVVTIHTYLEIYSYNHSFTCLNFCNNGLEEVAPCIESATMDFAKDLELPGFPTKNSGIFSSIQIIIINTFSRKALLRATFCGSFKLFKNTS